MAKESAYSTLAKEFNLLAEEPLKKYTSFKIGGPADLLAQPGDKKELKHLITRAADLHVPVTVFGGGTNLLIRDKGIRGLVILTRQIKSGVRLAAIDDTHTVVAVDAGEKLANLCRFANGEGLSGVEFAAGIPGTIGGALMMNAGTPKGRISDILVTMETLALPGMAIREIDRAALDFSYRHLKCEDVILAAHFRLAKADPSSVRARYREHLENKQTTQPIAFASAGCFFKNPSGALPAGKLIEDAGLKGKKINDAMVSDIHANYIVNLGTATCRDVLLLQEKIQNTVFEKFRVQLEAEVRIEGEN